MLANCWKLCVIAWNPTVWRFFAEHRVPRRAVVLQPIGHHVADFVDVMSLGRMLRDNVGDAFVTLIQQTGRDVRLVPGVLDYRPQYVLIR